METSLEPILAGHPFLSGLDPKHLGVLAGCAENMRFDAGQFLFREGEEANHFFFVRHGRVSIEIFSPQQHAITIETLSEGDVLGWSWLIPPYTWRFDARALEMTRTVTLDGKSLRAKCEDDHDLGYELMKRFANIIDRRLQATRMQLLDLYGA
jgi:CRP/FNR family transcriptional regulator, cyclic AMP receptor protein